MTAIPRWIEEGAGESLYTAKRRGPPSETTQEVRALRISARSSEHPKQSSLKIRRWHFNKELEEKKCHPRLLMCRSTLLSNPFKTCQEHQQNYPGTTGPRNSVSSGSHLNHKSTGPWETFHSPAQHIFTRL
jgi:hypothetical protein